MNSSSADNASGWATLPEIKYDGKNWIDLMRTFGEWVMRTDADVYRFVDQHSLPIQSVHSANCIFKYDKDSFDNYASNQKEKSAPKKIKAVNPRIIMENKNNDSSAHDPAVVSSSSSGVTGADDSMSRYSFAARKSFFGGSHLPFVEVEETSEKYPAHACYYLGDPYGAKRSTIHPRDVRDAMAWEADWNNRLLRITGSFLTLINTNIKLKLNEIPGELMSV